MFKGVGAMYKEGARAGTLYGKGWGLDPLQEPPPNIMTYTTENITSPLPSWRVVVKKILSQAKLNHNKKYTSENLEYKFCYIFHSHL